MLSLIFSNTQYASCILVDFFYTLSNFCATPSVVCYCITQMVKFLYVIDFDISNTYLSLYLILTTYSSLLALLLFEFSQFPF